MQVEDRHAALPAAIREHAEHVYALKKAWWSLERLCFFQLVLGLLILEVAAFGFLGALGGLKAPAKLWLLTGDNFLSCVYSVLGGFWFSNVFELRRARFPCLALCPLDCGLPALPDSPVVGAPKWAAAPPGVCAPPCPLPAQALRQRLARLRRASP